MSSKTTTEQSHQQRVDEKKARAVGQKREDAEAETTEDTVHLKIYRFDPDVEAKQDPYFEDILHYLL